MSTIGTIIVLLVAARLAWIAVVWAVRARRLTKGDAP